MDNQLDKEKLKSLGLPSPWRREGSGGTHHSVPVLERWLQEGWRLSLHKDSHGEDKGNRYKLPQAMFRPDIGKKYFYGENNHSLERPPQGHRVSMAGGFRDAIGQGTR